ncbi:MAG: hypothetical protein M1541_16310, partial [Acidobacteria bacterium]|nr:hypothetical protein [Acidobacteriota bacterium]
MVGAGAARTVSFISNEANAFALEAVPHPLRAVQVPRARLGTTDGLRPTATISGPVPLEG